MSEVQLFAAFAVCMAGAFTAGMIFGSWFPGKAETLRAYTANEEPQIPSRPDQRHKRMDVATILELQRLETERSKREARR